MTLFRVPTVVVDERGAPAADREVAILRDGGAAAAVYDAPEGGTTLPGPLRTDSLGGVPGWVEAGSYVAELTGAGTVFSRHFRVGRAGPPQPLELTGGWEDYPGYAASSFTVGSNGDVWVSGVIKSPEAGGDAYFAELPGEHAPSRTQEVVALLGVVTPAGVDPRPGAVVALSDGRLRAPNQPCRWLSLLAPIEY